MILDIPQEPTDRVVAFLWKYPYDPLALNDALRAVLVWDSISKAENCEAEVSASGIVDGVRGMKNPVPEVDLAHFIIYWPHYKRYHEVNHMSRYMHPFRFVHAHYGQDTLKHGVHMKIDSSSLNSERIRELVANLGLLSPDY
ncbi:hypothetical protein FPOAC2_05412 [Fusarium poae]|jgi:hypothetical protein|uniref:hypothetical protein n=1 Tax=Fusarium poae TaxID=36050 RepID=UPI001CE8A485|nr:hypothetical protein FPOAC1_005301 [Fusarium poae]KAG8672041.1 hypothetical protein FPOAC1_005301 [Fusarium poae]